MSTNIHDYAPFFHNGLLYLPEKTIALLLDAGLDAETAEAARNGLALDDDRALIGEISHTLEQVISQVSEDTQAYKQLNTQEAHFLLTGRAAR